MRPPLRVRVSVRDAVKRKRFELSTPKSAVEIYSVADTRHALTARSKGQRSRSQTWVCMSVRQRIIPVYVGSSLRRGISIYCRVARTLAVNTQVGVQSMLIFVVGGSDFRRIPAPSVRPCGLLILLLSGVRLLVFCRREEGSADCSPVVLLTPSVRRPTEQLF